MDGPVGSQQFRPPLPVGPRPPLQPGMMGQQQNLQLQPGMDNRMRLLLQQRQAENAGPGMENTTAQSPLLAQQLTGMANQAPAQQQQAKPAADSDLLDGDIDANLGMNDDDLLGDFGDDFNILEFADALDGNDTNKTNILDDLEAEEEEEGGAKPVQKVGEGESKPPPYGPGGNPQDPSRGPPPPYPGQPKVRQQAWF